jgi:hypothetical protein
MLATRRPAALLVALVLSAGCVEHARPEPDPTFDASSFGPGGGDAGSFADAGGNGRVDGGTPATCEPDAGLVTCTSDGGVRFSQVQELLERSCVVCHKPGAKIFGGVLLTADVSYANLVLAPSSCDPVLMRVQPGLSEQSVLWLKIADRACGCGRFRSMPPGTRGLLATPEDFCTLESWIRQGATSE